MGKPRKKQARKHTSDPHPKGSFRRLEAIIFPIIIILLIGYFIMSKASGDDTIDENYLIVSIVFFMALMVVSIPRSSPGHSRKRAAPKKRPKPQHKGKPGKKVPSSAKTNVIEEVEEIEDVQKERKIISYPGAASGGKYGDAYVAISQEMILKVRSLLAVSCKNCKDIDTCWEKHKDTMDYDTFLESTECHEKMDPAVISAAPPIQITEEAPEVEPVVAEEEIEVQEEAVEIDEPAGEAEDDDDWGSEESDEFEVEPEDHDHEDDGDEYEDEYQDEYEDDDDSGWE